jgi:hypothetical protein
VTGGKEGRAATGDDRIAEHPQLMDQVEFERLHGWAGAADRDVPISFAASATATSSTTGASASRALPTTWSSVRLKTTFGTAHQTSANAAP